MKRLPNVRILDSQQVIMIYFSSAQRALPNFAFENTVFFLLRSTLVLFYLRVYHVAVLCHLVRRVVGVCCVRSKCMMFRGMDSWCFLRTMGPCSWYGLAVVLVLQGVVVIRSRERSGREMRPAWMSVV